MKLSGALVPMAAVGLGAFASGCGSLDQDKVQNGIKSGIEKQTPVKVRSVACPKDRPVKKGDRFTCKVTATDGQTGTVQVEQTNNKGDVSWRLGRR